MKNNLKLLLSVLFAMMFFTAVGFAQNANVTSTDLGTTSVKSEKSSKGKKSNKCKKHHKKNQKQTKKTND